MGSDETGTNQDKSLPLFLAGGGAVLIVIGSFLPWAVVRTGFGQISKAGTEGDGVFTLIGGLVIGFLAFLFYSQGKSTGIPIGILALLAGAVAVLDAVDVQSKFAAVNNEFAQGSIGTGLYITILGAVAALLGAFNIYRRRGFFP
jgi:hypothetical protein